MILDKRIAVKIRGKNYFLCFPVACIFEAEQEMQRKNLLLTFANPPLSLSDTFVLFKYGIIGGDATLREMKDTYFEELYLDAVAELTLPVIMAKVSEAVNKSGILGREKKAQAAKKA